MTEPNEVGYYTDLPDDYRHAIREDFFEKDKPVTDMIYLIQSFHDKMYYIHKVTRNFNYENLAVWIQHKMVYVSKNDNFLTRNRKKKESAQSEKKNVVENKDLDF